MRTPKALRALALALLASGALVAAGCGDDKNDTTNPVLELNITGIAPAATVSHQFNATGSFPYHCSIHPAMRGSVTCSAAGALTDTVHIISNSTGGFSPSTIDVKTGGTIFWINETGTTHTVTSD